MSYFRFCVFLTSTNHGVRYSRHCSILDKVIIHSKDVQAEFKALCDSCLKDVPTSKQSVATQTPRPFTKVRVSIILIARDHSRHPRLSFDFHFRVFFSWPNRTISNPKNSRARTAAPDGACLTAVTTGATEPMTWSFPMTANGKSCNTAPKRAPTCTGPNCPSRATPISDLASPKPKCFDRRVAPATLADLSIAAPVNAKNAATRARFSRTRRRTATVPKRSRS